MFNIVRGYKSQAAYQVLYNKIDSSKGWKTWLKTDPNNIDMLKHNFRTGHPLGSEPFIRKAEAITGCELFQKPAGQPKE